MTGGEEALLEGDEEFVGVPTPTKPEIATVSPSRMTDTASSGLTIFPSISLAIDQPLEHGVADDALALRADIDPDMPAGQRQLG